MGVSTLKCTHRDNVEFQMAKSRQRVVRTTSCFVLGSGFRGRRMELRYFRFEQIQDGSRRHLEKLQRHRTVSLRQHGLLVFIANVLLCATYCLCGNFRDNNSHCQK